MQPLVHNIGKYDLLMIFGNCLVVGFWDTASLVSIHHYQVNPILLVVMI